MAGEKMDRNCTGIWKILTFLAVFLFGFQSVSGQSFWCPPSSEILPAYCIEQPAAGYKLEFFIQYWGDVQTPVGQSVIDNLFNLAKITNDLSIDEDWLQVHAFNVRNVILSPLNLSALARVRMDELYFDNCPHITEISDGPRDQSLAVRSVSAPDGFGDKEFSQLLSYLSPSDLETFGFGGCKLTEDFIPPSDAENRNPLEPFKFLDSLYIGGNQMKRIGGGQFRHNLRLIYLSVGNEGMEVGENAFWFNQPDEQILREMSTVELKIVFAPSNLTDEMIHPNLGLTSLSYRPVYLDIYGNGLETLDASKWEEFLYAHPDNKIQVSMNPIICDERVKWLKDAREKLESKVLWARCANDPGKTVFDSDLIP